jgi:hypothetical protein
MKWLNPKPKPVIGDTRGRFPFAWLPTQVGPYRVWLERYWVKQVYTHDLTWVEIDRGVPVHYY